MRSFRAAAALAACALLVPAVASAAPLSPLSAVTYDAAATARLYSVTNAHRRAIGRPALSLDARLAAVARTWTTSMATSGTLAHNDALFTREMHALLRIARFGENVAFASRGVDSAHEALLASPHHRENIESPHFAVAGFAVVVDAKGVTWVTQDFGSTPKAVVTTAPAPVARRAVARPAAPARPAARPVARHSPAARPVARPVPKAYVAPAAPRRDPAGDRVDPAAAGAGTAATGAPPAAVLTAVTREDAAMPPALPLAAAAAVLLAGTLTGVAGVARRRSARLER